MTSRSIWYTGRFPVRMSDKLDIPVDFRYIVPPGVLGVDSCAIWVWSCYACPMMHTKTYAVPTSTPSVAGRMVIDLLREFDAYDLFTRIFVVGTNSTNPRTGEPEVLVEVRGDERTHSAMLSACEWCGF